jgi:hypothetical protein
MTMRNSIIALSLVIIAGTGGLYLVLESKTDYYEEKPSIQLIKLEDRHSLIHNGTHTQEGKEILWNLELDYNNNLDYLNYQQCLDYQEFSSFRHGNYCYNISDSITCMSDYFDNCTPLEKKDWDWYDEEKKEWVYPIDQELEEDFNPNFMRTNWKTLYLNTIYPCSAPWEIEIAENNTGSFYRCNLEFEYLEKPFE